ncbi:MAG TPA: hypothetical protein VML19_34170, partial [Verrucomicrobiae bacterium]|nr:hypothetical protein [Verrucomicrobiae bacterium]
LAEKDTAIAEAQTALAHLANARPHLTSDQYGDLDWRLTLAERTAIIWKLHAEALFGYKALAAGHAVPGLAERVARALAALREQADVSARDPRIGNAPPASAKEIRAFAADLEKRLASLNNYRTSGR